MHGFISGFSILFQRSVFLFFVPVTYYFDDCISIVCVPGILIPPAPIFFLARLLLAIQGLLCLRLEISLNKRLHLHKIKVRDNLKLEKSHLNNSADHIHKSTEENSSFLKCITSKISFCIKIPYQTKI